MHRTTGPPTSTFTPPPSPSLPPLLELCFSSVLFGLLTYSFSHCPRFHIGLKPATGQTPSILFPPFCKPHQCRGLFPCSQSLGRCIFSFTPGSFRASIASHTANAIKVEKKSHKVEGKPFVASQRTKDRHQRSAKSLHRAHKHSELNTETTHLKKYLASITRRKRISMRACWSQDGQQLAKSKKCQSQGYSERAHGGKAAHRAGQKFIQGEKKQRRNGTWWNRNPCVFEVPHSFTTRTHAVQIIEPAQGKEVAQLHTEQRHSVEKKRKSCRVGTLRRLVD